MSADTVSIMGIFSSENSAALAIDGLRETDWTIERVHSPIPSHTIEDALEPPNSRVGWFTLVGGIIGLQVLNLFVMQSLDVLTMLGFVILIGTVVNNPILML